MSLAVGLMSGTSLDGVDAALVDIKGTQQNLHVELHDFITVPYSSNQLRQIKDVIEERELTIQKVSALNFSLGEKYSEVVQMICQKNMLDSGKLSFVASHGQTVFHQPFPSETFQPSTLQLGDPSIMANRLKTTIVSNFREADMAVKGQGAPIVPYSEFLLYRSTSKNRILQNIGGIGNLTLIPANAELKELIAFDTGPGNMIIDGLMKHFYHKKFDRYGARAAKGRVNDQLVKEWMDLPYFKLPYPKTTGRELFGNVFLKDILKNSEIKPDDLIASATFFTAKSIAFHVMQLVNDETELIIGGGGAYNKTLVSMLKNLLPNFIKIFVQEDIGISSEAKEAIAVAILGQHTLAHLPSNVPSATGASNKVILGRITLFK